MIDEIESRSGHRVLRCNGRLLASQENPVHAAQRWVQSNYERIKGRHSVVVLGAGSGYHLELLANQASIETVVGIELDNEVCQWNQSNLKLNSKIHLLCPAQFSDITNCSAIKKAVSRSYAVLKYFPSLSTNPQRYSEIFYFLLGRSPDGANFLLAQRGILSSLQFNSRRRELVSIKTILNHIAKTKKTSEASIPVWRALGELIK